MIPALGRLSMTKYTRMILWIIVLLVGLQWVVPDPSDASLTAGGNLAATWDDQDDDLDDSDRDGHTPQTDFAFLPDDMSMAEPTIPGWLLPTSDVNNLRRLAVSHRIPRAPPVAAIQITVHPYSIFSGRSSALSAIIPTPQSQPPQALKELPTVSTNLLFPVAISSDSLTQIFHGKEAVFTEADNDPTSLDGLYGLAVTPCSTS
ncbi:MAG TPA: hypothetical protein VLM91_10565 [Candidatus Methylomirabilis sp.]|nr:hypothetical protein [Candidatus Methylomirabilis sp.]